MNIHAAVPLSWSPSDISGNQLTRAEWLKPQSRVGCIRKQRKRKKEEKKRKSNKKKKTNEKRGRVTERRGEAAGGPKSVAAALSVNYLASPLITNDGRA